VEKLIKRRHLESSSISSSSSSSSTSNNNNNSSSSSSSCSSSSSSSSSCIFSNAVECNSNTTELNFIKNIPSMEMSRKIFNVTFYVQLFTAIMVFFIKYFCKVKMCTAGDVSPTKMSLLSLKF
jgi:hypothetical protein